MRLDVGTPEALGLGLPFRCNVVAELNSGLAVEAAIGLLVDMARAVWVFGDKVCR